MITESQEPKWVKKLLLLSATLFLATQTYLTAAPFLARELPVETDDAYTYIQKAEQMRTCFLQNCPALNSLRQQILAPGGEESVKMIQDRQYHRLFVVYHPLHSVLLLALRGLGLSYETGYVVLAIFAKAILSLGIIVWLVQLFGKQTAALALVLLTPVVHIGTGLHTMVPSTMALGLAFWLWVLSTRQRTQKHWLVLLALAMMLLHQVGKIYAGIGLLLYAATHLYSLLRSRREQAFVISAGLLIGGFLLLPYLITTPLMNFDPTLFYPHEWETLAEILPASVRPLQIIEVWLQSFTFPIFAVILIGFGIYSAWRHKFNVAVYTLGAFTLQGIAGLLYVVPWFGALLFERVWVPMALLLTGFIASGILAAARYLFATVQNWRAGIHITKLGQVFISTVVLLSALAAAITYPSFYIRHYKLTLANQIDRQNFSINPSQAEIINSTLHNSNDLVLYSHEIPLYYFLSRGGYAREAVFLPIVKDTDQADYWLEERAGDIRYLVALSPYPDKAGIPISSEMHIRPYQQSQLDTNPLALHLRAASGATITIEWEANGTTRTIEHDLPSEFDGWVKFPQIAQANSIRLSSNQAAYLTGVQLDTRQETEWPWETGIVIEVMDADGPREIRFSLDALYDDPSLVLDVVDDQGAFVLAKATARP